MVKIKLGSQFQKKIGKYSLKSIYIYVCVCVYVCVCIYIYIYVCAYIWRHAVLTYKVTSKRHNYILFYASIFKLTYINSFLYLHMHRGRMYRKIYIDQSVVQLVMSKVSKWSRGPIFFFIHFSSARICFILDYNKHELLKTTTTKKEGRAVCLVSTSGCPTWPKASVGHPLASQCSGFPTGKRFHPGLISPCPTWESG